MHLPGPDISSYFLHSSFPTFSLLSSQNPFKCQGFHNHCHNNPGNRILGVCQKGLADRWLLGNAGFSILEHFYEKHWKGSMSFLKWHLVPMAPGVDLISNRQGQATNTHADSRGFCATKGPRQNCSHWESLSHKVRVTRHQKHVTQALCSDSSWILWIISSHHCSLRYL